MPTELLLEIGSEEIPAGFIPGALDSLGKLAESSLREARLAHGTITTLGNPRRLTLIIEDVSERQEDVIREVTGPPKKAAYDAEGRPTKAAEGFARSQGVDIGSLKVKATDKGEYLCAVIDEPGRAALEVMAEILPKLILSITFPKSMRWMDHEIRYARPIHWILALLGHEVIDFELDGVRSSNLSRGHRFMSPGAFMVQGAGSYLNQCADNYTILDPLERRRMVDKQISVLASSVGADVLPDEGLMVEVGNLVEYPVALMGRFDKEFLNLPREVLVNAMREHQRYFALTDKDGYLMPNFITVSNTKAEDMEVVRAGNERVLRARLSDARFFFEEDMAKTLDDRVPDLKKVVFQEKLGSVYDKVQRVVHLSEYVAETLYADHDVTKHAKRAAKLCKADLVTSMVYEFANLQGIVGGDYAHRNGEHEDVATAIREHYMPRFSGDRVPETKTGTAVSVSDKMDTIAAIFSIGKPPTGSEDPYALRRQALGVISIIYQGNIRMSLGALIARAVELLKVKEDSKASLEADILEFFRQRVNNQLSSEKFAYDIINAVLEREFDDIIDIKDRVVSLTEFRLTPEFAPFMTAFKRVANIIPDGFEGAVDEGLLTDGAEKELFAHYRSISGEVYSLIDGRRYMDALSTIATLRPYVDKFFDDVMVMDKDEKIRNNRLALLNLLAGMFFKIADLKEISVTVGGGTVSKLGINAQDRP
jgi:glycyl-tRNA synthetase beta chain